MPFLNKLIPKFPKAIALLGKILVYPPQPKEFTVKIIARIMYPDDQYLEKISTVMVGGAGVTIESNEIRNSLILATLKVAPGASGGRFSITYENEDNPNHKGCNVRLLPVEIVPDDDQPGKTGDQIPSNIGATGEKHYVSPKKSAEIADDFVILKAKGIDKELFEKVLKWGCAPAANGSVDPNESTKYRVKRDATGKTVVKLKTKDGGQEVDLMNVWVVWSDSVVAGTIAIKPTVANQPPIGAVTTVKGGLQYTHTILPPGIINDPNDRPNLEGAKTVNPPGGNHALFGTPLADGANNKWDASRQFRFKHSNPKGLPAHAFSQPAPLINVLQFPKDAVLGNDDAWIQDEIPRPGGNPVGQANDPYQNQSLRVLWSTDVPSFSISKGNLNDTYVFHLQLKEFSRLQIGDKWYRVSDQLPWRFKVHMRKVRHPQQGFDFWNVDSQVKNPAVIQTNHNDF